MENETVSKTSVFETVAVSVVDPGDFRPTLFETVLKFVKV